MIATSNNTNRIAILDLGTNTFHLLITEIKEGKIIELYKTFLPVKLGEGGISKGEISETAFKRGITALVQYKDTITTYGATLIKAFATAAVRTASNGQAFINAAFEQTGIQIELIDGNREAELIYKGVNAAVHIQQASLIMDIGGGSVEFIHCNPGGIQWKKSYPIGAQRLIDRFHHNDPIASEEIEALNTYLDEILADLLDISTVYTPQVLIGSAGAFETFAEMIVLHKQRDTALLQQTFFDFEPEDMAWLNTTLVGSTHEQRTMMPGLIPLRVDMIVVANLLTNYITKQLKIQKVQLSAYSLKEGAMVEMAESKGH